MFGRLKARALGFWRSSDRVQRGLLFLAVTFSILAKILTWYGIEYLGFVESSLGTLRFIQGYGTSIGLILNGMTVVVGFLIVWMIWASYRGRVQEQGFEFPFILSTLIFIWFFWMTAIDVSHDLAMVLFHSKIFEPLVNYWHPALLATITTIAYLRHVFNSVKA